MTDFKSLSLDKQQSLLFNGLRLPLMLGVILIHTIPMYNASLPNISEGFGEWLYMFVTQLLSENVFRAVVPCFFVISAYYLFIKFDKEKQFSGEDFALLKKRLPPLVIPYLLWNVIYYIVYFSKTTIFAHYNLPVMPHIVKHLEEYSFLYWIVDTLNAPFWYIQALICMIVLSPAFFYLFKYLKRWGLLLLLLVYWLCYFYEGVGLNLTGMMFFGLGAYMGLYRKNFIALVNKFRWLILPIALVIPILITLYSQLIMEDVELAIKLYVPFGVLSIIYLFHKLYSLSPRILDFCLKYSSSIFFVYAVNELYILHWTKGLLTRLLPITNPYVHLLYYFLVAPIVVGVCIVLYHLMKRFTPRILKVLCGGRI